MLIQCPIRQELIGEYLNAIADEQRAENDEQRAFAHVACEVARAATLRAVRVRDYCRERLVQHCLHHNCCPMSDLEEIATDPHGHKRKRDGYRLR